MSVEAPTIAPSRTDSPADSGALERALFPNDGLIHLTRDGSDGPVKAFCGADIHSQEHLGIDEDKVCPLCIEIGAAGYGITRERFVRALRKRGILR